ncbi:MAG: hypothetical protein E7257_00625 [Lachnospiraceae bacterium]|nr:hypothetical protein [Lachnospiraceae bacterium]
MKKNGIKALACLMVMVTTLTACGEKKEVDYVDNQNVSESVASMEEVSGGASSEATGEVVYEEAPEHITYDVVCDRVTVTVDADVSLPQKYEQCKVVELEKSVMSDEELKSYVESTFDEGSYFLYMPYSEDEIANAKDKLISIAAQTSDERLSSVINDVIIPQLDASVDTYADSDNTITDEMKFQSLNVIAGMGNELLPCEMCNVIGTIDGEYYIIEAYRDKTNQFVRLSKLSDAGKAATDVGPGYAEMTGEANSCEYSREEAQQLALDYVNGLGIENMSVVYTADVLTSSYDAGEEIVYIGEGYDNSSKLEGYNVYLARSYDDYKIVFTSEQFVNWYDVAYEDAASGELVTMRGSEFIRVWVTSDGIAAYENCNELTEVNVTAEAANLLDFNSVNEVAKDYIMDFANTYEAAFDVDRITLGYAMVEQDGKYAIIPAWYYFMSDGDVNNIDAYEFPVVVINALDGTIVELVTSSLQ